MKKTVFEIEENSKLIWAILKMSEIIDNLFFKTHNKPLLGIMHSPTRTKFIEENEIMIPTHYVSYCICFFRQHPVFKMISLRY